MRHAKWQLNVYKLTLWKVHDVEFFVSQFTMLLHPFLVTWHWKKHRSEQELSKISKESYKKLCVLRGCFSAGWRGVLETCDPPLLSTMTAPTGKGLQYAVVKVWRRDWLPSVQGDVDKYGEKVRGEQNFLIYWTHETCQGRKPSQMYSMRTNLPTL